MSMGFEKVYKSDCFIIDQIDLFNKKKNYYFVINTTNTTILRNIKYFNNEVLKTQKCKEADTIKVKMSF